jgi:hypothetical protein
MKIAYFDCIAGASGDMMLGALLDAGLSESVLRQQLAALRLAEFELTSRRTIRHGFSALKVDVAARDDVPARHLSDILATVADSDLAPPIKERAAAIFRRLGEVEAAIHGVSPDQVHLHELGGVDTMVDVVGVLLGLAELGIDQVVVSPLPLGRGFVQGAHGAIPLPAPATLALLKGAPLFGSPLDAELVTPTGAVLLSSLASSFGPIPPMTLEAIGYGAGGRDLPIPNLLRLLVGQPAGASGASLEMLVTLETNIDDLNPEFYDYVMARLFEAGALDVFLSPLHMKKNRPGVLLQVLCRPADADPLTAILFAETSTLGVRQQRVERHCLPRALRTVATEYGPVQVKLVHWGAGQLKAKPEYEDCRRLAEAHHIPLREVYGAAEQAARQLRN